MTPREHAQELAKYYARLNGKHPGDEEWAIGRKIAEEWLTLIDQPEPARVTNLLRDAETAQARKGAGSGILDMSMSIRSWAKSLKR
jgi:hypothetical protein